MGLDRSEAVNKIYLLTYCDRQTDGRAYGQTDRSVLRAAWSQLRMHGHARNVKSRFHARLGRIYVFTQEKALFHVSRKIIDPQVTRPTHGW